MVGIAFCHLAGSHEFERAKEQAGVKLRHPKRRPRLRINKIVALGKIERRKSITEILLKLEKLQEIKALKADEIENWN
jgi:hypothetical protein